MLLSSSGVAHCLRYTYRGAARALPQGKIIPVKWVNSQFLWYKTMRWLDRELAGRRYVAGDTYSIADITALCGIDFCKLVELDIPADCANLRRWYDEVASRPSAAA